MKNKNKVVFFGAFTWLGQIRSVNERRRVFGIIVKKEGGYVLMRVVHMQDPRQWIEEDVKLSKKMYQEMFEIVKKFAQDNELSTGSYGVADYINQEIQTLQEMGFSFPTIWIELGESEESDEFFRKLQERLAEAGELEIKQYPVGKAD